MFAVFGMLSVCFYEPAIVVYIILTLFIVWNNYKNKKDLLPLAIMAAHIAIIGIYYILNSGSGEIESRGGFLETDILEHTALVTDYTKYFRLYSVYFRLYVLKSVNFLGKYLCLEL